MDKGYGGGEYLFFTFMGTVFVIKGCVWLQAFLSNPVRLAIASIILLLLSSPLFWLLWKWRVRNLAKRAAEDSIIGKEDNAVYCGETDLDESVWIKTRQRAMHTQVVGTTNAGKTESVILPWAIQDIEAGRGLLIIDGKADHSLLYKLWSYSVRAGRKDDFKLFSLGKMAQSIQFNPLKGGTAEEITERVFNAFDFENPHYRNLQYEVMKQIMRIFESTKTEPTFQRLYQAITTPELLEDLSDKIDDVELRQWVLRFRALSQTDRENRTIGLVTALGHFSHGAPGKLFNGFDDALTIDQALSENKIVYFQLPVLLSPFLGKATGKLVLQSLQAAVANRHRASGEKKFFSVFLDDFTEYLYPGFVSILNKSRSANVGVAFAHQALGDITELGDSVANSILTNSNIKIFMRGNDPDSAEYFSKVIGTLTSTKFTERQKAGLFNNQKTGDVSAREAEEFIIHPNTFKQNLGVGEAVMIVPHERGSKTIRIKFHKMEDLLMPEELPVKNKITVPLLKLKESPVVAKAEENDSKVRSSDQGEEGAFHSKGEINA